MSTGRAATKNFEPHTVNWLIQGCVGSTGRAATQIFELHTVDCLIQGCVLGTGRAAAEERVDDHSPERGGLESGQDELVKL